jgi:hypothetical protein
LPMQMDELGEDMAIDEFKKVLGRSKTIETTEAGSPPLFAYLCPRANFPKVYSRSKAGAGVCSGASIMGSK